MEPAEDHEHVFSDGLYLANLTMSSSILMDSWKAITEAQGKNTIEINKDHPDYNIIAIVSSPVTTSNPPEKRHLVTITEDSDFAFLRSDTVQSLSIDEAALSLFGNLQELRQRQEEVTSSGREASLSSTNKNKKKEPICYIITGCGLDGSVASLFTLSLLNTLNPTEFRLLCITFGSPLLGDASFQQAISRHSTWNSCFLHVVQRGDRVPRSYLDPSPADQTPYQPFGRFVLCSESGGASFQAPESVIKLLKYENPQAVAENQKPQTIKYEEVISRSNVSSFLGFDNDLYLANLAVPSNLLTDSWNAISKHQGDDHITIINHHSAYNIIAFVSSPVTPSNLEQESHSVPVLEISDFQFLCSDTPLSFLINKAAVSLFNSFHGKLSQLQEKVKTSSESDASSSSAEKNKRPIPYIITGRGLNGSVASLFTLLLLNTLDPSKFKIRCITFGSPLLWVTDFQQAVLRHPTWNPCFLHVVHKDDCVPRLSLVSTHEPFGTFLLCSDKSDAYFQNPGCVIDWLKGKKAEAVAENQKSGTFDYKNVLECVEKKLLERDFEAGITGQVAAVGLWQPQPQNEGISAMIESIIKHEQDIIKRQREEFDPHKELEEMKILMTFLEWYINICRANGQGPGYYDSFKSARERHDNGVDKYKTYLTDYWEKVVDHVEKKPQRPHAPLRIRLLYAGTNYRRIVEPLDIAEYYRRGRKDYLTRGRSQHYERLEKWLEDHQNSKKERKKGKETDDGPSNSEVVNVTEDSCFWARVEDAIRSCRLPDRARTGSSDGPEKEKSFEEYVMDLIKKKKVSSDIFLEKSSYMQWWREYEISNNVKKGSKLVDFMEQRGYENYGKGSPTDSNENPSDTSHSDPSTSGDHRG